VADKVIALLRLVNIGRRRASMAKLRDGLTKVGCAEVVIYVQSGNIVLVPPPELPAVTNWLESTLSQLARFSIVVVTRTAGELREAVANNPYPLAGAAQLHVTFWGGKQLSTLPASTWGPLARDTPRRVPARVVPPSPERDEHVEVGSCSRAGQGH
jgi:uncharacterized protein (DUF1697 family)